jgi:hypothetical protein
MTSTVHRGASNRSSMDTRQSREYESHYLKSLHLPDRVLQSRTPSRTTSNTIYRPPAAHRNDIPWICGAPQHRASKYCSLSVEYALPQHQLVPPPIVTNSHGIHVMGLTATRVHPCMDERQGCWTVAVTAGTMCCASSWQSSNGINYKHSSKILSGHTVSNGFTPTQHTKHARLISLQGWLETPR